MTRYVYMSKDAEEKRRRSEIRWAFVGGALVMGVLMMIAWAVMGLA